MSYNCPKGWHFVIVAHSIFMQHQYLLISAGIAVFSFFLQSWPRFVNKSFGVDVWTRLLEVSHIRQNNHRVPGAALSDQFMVSGYFDYPPVFPIMLSYIPKKLLDRIKGFIAPLFDVMQGMFLFYISYFLTQDMWFAIVAQTTYVLTPVIAAENSQLTPRSLGYFNFSLATVPLLMYFYQPNPWLFWAGAFMTGMLFLTHRFALQAFIFLTIFFTFFLNTAIFVQALLIGFVAALIVTRGYYLRVARGHLANIYFWIINLDARYAHQVRGIIKKDVQMDLINRLYKIVEVFSPIAIFGMNPWAFSGIMYLIFVATNMLPLHPFLTVITSWILFFYVLGVVILKTRRLMPIGEGYRYMEMATVPSAFLSTSLLFFLITTPYRSVSIGLYGALLVVCLGIILFFQIKSVIGDRNRSVTDDMSRVFSYINKHHSSKNPMKILCIPHQNTTMTIYHTKAQVFVNADNMGLMKVTDVYPQLKRTLTELKKKYGLTHVLLKTGFVTLSELRLTQKQVEYESGDVILAAL